MNTIEENTGRKIWLLEKQIEALKNHTNAQFQEFERMRESYDTLATEHCLAINKLAQERDEAREKVEQQRKEIVRLNGATNHAGGTPIKIALRERDEARELADRYRVAFCSVKGDLVPTPFPWEGAK